MKKNHLIHVTELSQIPPPEQVKTIKLMEMTTFPWAREAKAEALQMTQKLQDEVKDNPSLRGKYFKYLRRLLELKFEAEELAFANSEKLSQDPPKELSQPLQIESLRIVPFLSCTQITMWKNCPRRYYWRYALGIKTPKTSALHIGSSVDTALNFYFEGKKNGKAPPLGAVFAQFHEAFEKEKDTVDWGPSDPIKLQRHGPVVIEAYLKRFDEITFPTAVQQEIKIHLDHDGLLVGAIDLVTEDSLIDTKTAKEPWAEDKHKKEIQPLAYTFAFYEERKKMPKSFKYQIVTKEEVPQTQLITFEVKKYQIESFYRETSQIWADISAALKLGKEAFPAEANKSRPSPLCSTNYCDFASYCIQDGLKIGRWDKGLKRHVYDATP